MRVIVNENQYNNILIEEKKEYNPLKKWAAYISDILLPKVISLDVSIEEDIFTDKNLSKKLGNHDFFKFLPIDSIIFNIIIKDNNKEPNIDINYYPYWTTVVNNILVDVEFDVEVYSLDKINLKTVKYDIETYLLKELIKVNSWYKENIEE